MKFEINSLPRNCSNEEIIAEIRRVDAIVEKDVLTQLDYKKIGKMSPSGIRGRLGDWQNALIAAGLGHKYFGTNISEKARRQKARQLPDQAILDELRRLATSLGKGSVTVEDLKNHSEVQSSEQR